MKINDDYDWQGETALTLDAYHLKEVEDALAELDWLEIRIKRRKASMRPEIIVRKTIITKKIRK